MILSLNTGGVWESLREIEQRPMERVGGQLRADAAAAPLEPEKLIARVLAMSTDKQAIRMSGLLISDGLPDLADEQVMRQAWRRY